MSDLADLLHHVPVPETAKDMVVQRMQEPHRRYHNLDHVLEMWVWYKQHCMYRGDHIDAIVGSFCLYHDAIYDPRSADNEQRSAHLWLSDTLADDYIRDAVHNSILASADHFHRDTCWDASMHWCLDLDLLRLGSPEAKFIQHGQDIRREYDHLTDQQWTRASSEFRARVIAQPKIFVFSPFAQIELQARRNLARALLQDWQALGWLD